MTGSEPQSEMLDESAQECPPPRTREAVDCWLRKWGRDAVVDGKEPLTREDVERLIEANGGTAEKLDLSQRNLQGAHFLAAKLQGANLWDAKLQGADLMSANLQGADLTVMQISTATNLGNVKWHEGYVLPSERKGLFTASQSTYRSLKTWHQEHGFYDIAGEFHHREMVCRRKAIFPKLFGFMLRKHILLRWLIAVLPSVLMALTPIIGLVALLARPQKESWLARFWELARLNFYEQLFGYGERPWRVVRAAVVVVLGLAAAYYFKGSFTMPPSNPGPFRPMDALYFSAVSFSALGYGSWAPEPLGWAKYMGVVESYLGVFTIALFLVTFTRKMVR